jgi:CheY-like chemotaxis protein
MLQLIVRMLNDLEISEVTTAKNGSEGLTEVEQSRKDFDLIICDLEMPMMNGFEFVDDLRKSTDTVSARTPVIILTGHSHEQAVRNAVELGIHGFLAKPLTEGALEKKIVSALTSPPIDPEVLKR